MFDRDLSGGPGELGRQGPLEKLFALERFGIKLGLENIETICQAMGKPQQAFQSIIVGGTNGKGSVTAMIETALRAAGHPTGRYTSPHLIRLEERFFIGGRPIASGDLERLASSVLTLCDQLSSRNRLRTQPTFFEATTAIAFEAFRQGGVRLAVLEVGLGGRFDATNIVTPMAGAITTVDRDHEQYLGHEIHQIAAEKAGIVKRGMPLVVGELSSEARAVVERTCQALEAKLVVASSQARRRVAARDGKTNLELDTESDHYGPVTLALRGRHQVDNAIVAVLLLEELRAQGIEVPRESIEAGLRDVRWPGRLDLVPIGDGSSVLFDAAHNPAGAHALAEYIHDTYRHGLPFVFGILADKDAASVLSALEPVASRFVFTRPRSLRAQDPEMLRSMIRDVLVDVVEDPLDALDRARLFGPVVGVTGSLFLVGELYERLKLEI